MENKHLILVSEKTFNFYTNSEHKVIKYFTKDLGRYLLLLKVMQSHFSDQKLSQERILEAISSTIASRSNLLSVINHCIEMRYFSKEPEIDNKRKKLILPSLELVQQYKSWIKEMQKLNYSDHC